MNLNEILAELEKPADKRRGNFALRFPYQEAAELLAAEVTRLRFLLSESPPPVPLEVLQCGAAIDLNQIKAARLSEAELMAYEETKLRDRLAVDMARRIREGKVGSIIARDVGGLRFLRLRLRVSKPQEKGQLTGQ